MPNNAPGTTDGPTRSTCVAGWISCVGEAVQICTSASYPDSIERKSMPNTPHKGRTGAGDIANFGQVWRMVKVMSPSSMERLIVIMDFYGAMVCWYSFASIPTKRQEHQETHKNEDGKPDPDSLLGKLMKARSFIVWSKLSPLSWYVLVHVARTTWTKGLERHALGW